MLKCGNDILKVSNDWLIEPVDPYNPLYLPRNTIRVRTNDGNVPIRFSEYSSSTSYETATLVQGTSDVYDVYKSGTDLSLLLYRSTNVVEVLGANTTGITDMGAMFFGCDALTSVPLFDTSSARSMARMFAGCINVQSGALALYQYASTHHDPIFGHEETFKNCGSNTTTGAAELAQIPASWGGTGA